MAHVQGASAMAAASKAGAAKAMEHGMEGMMKNMMMGEGMGSMMRQGMAQAAPAVSFHNVAKGAAATGAMVTASSSSGRSLVSRIFKHPLVLFGIGVAVGYTVHKYRKEIIGAANRAAEKGKDFVLQQRENLEDIVAESRETQD